ncbi:MAG: Uma2 family endonuclease [Gemmataceae bacterium]
MTPTSTTSGPPVVPAPPRLTAEEFVARHGGERVELVKGVIKEVAMPMPRHGAICAKMTILIGAHVETHDLGHVMSNDSFIKTGPESVRGADVSFWSYERQPRGPIPDGLLPQAPDLVVEVKSPSDRWGDLFAKVGEYLQVGVRVVVVVDPGTSSASVYRQEELSQTFHNGDELALPDVLPGFAVKVSRLFA